MVQVAAIGYGYWGPKLVRNFSALETCQLVSISDLNETRLRKIKTAYPQIQIWIPIIIRLRLREVD